MCAVFRPSQDGESENARVVESTGCAFNSEKAFLWWLSLCRQRKLPAAGGSPALRSEATGSLLSQDDEPRSLDSRLREDDELKPSHWSPACATMTNKRIRIGEGKITTPAATSPRTAPHPVPASATPPARRDNPAPGPARSPARSHAPARARRHAPRAATAARPC